MLCITYAFLQYAPEQNNQKINSVYIFLKEVVS